MTRKARPTWRAFCVGPAMADISDQGLTPAKLSRQPQQPCRDQSDCGKDDDLRFPMTADTGTANTGTANTGTANTGTAAACRASSNLQPMTPPKPPTANTAVLHSGQAVPRWPRSRPLPGRWG